MRPWLSPLLVVLAACSGTSAPPPPVAVASASPSADTLRPLSSRDTSLPEGHPPIPSTDPHGNIVTGDAPTSPAGAVSGTIALAGGLEVGPKDVLYVMAKKGGATIAVRRVEAPRFPYAFEISGGDTMMSGIAFVGPVDVVARISKTGDAIASKGDLEGTTRDVAVPSRGVPLTIDRVRE